MAEIITQFQTITKYGQIEEHIRKMINNGTYPVNSKVPSERDMAKTYNISVLTINKAITNLVNDELLYRVQGKGTFVSEKKKTDRIIELLFVHPEALSNDEFHSPIFKGILDTAHKAGYEIISRHLMKSDASANFGILKKSPARARLLVGSGDPRKINILLKDKIPFLIVYAASDKPGARYISVDLRDSIKDSISLLSSKGKNRIAYVGITHGDPGPDIDKFEIYKKTLDSLKIGVNPKLVESAGHSQEDGYKAMKKILSRAKPNGVILSCDVLAPGVYRAISEHGLKIPQDIGVIGCDDLEVGRLLSPQLTTIYIPRREIGVAACEKIIESVEENKAINNELLPSRLIVRESV